MSLKALLYAGNTAVCSQDCAFEYAIKKQAKRKDKEDKEFRRETRKMKEDARTRTKWYKLLEEEVNRHVRLRDADKLCCTCKTATADSFFHAGHFLSVGASKDTRFNLMNIHKQCAQCNKFGGGERDRYRVFMVEKYGEDRVKFLEGPQPTLKQQFPTTLDIKDEIAKYKKMNKEISKCLR
jgi:hypothetical protein